VDPWDGSRTLGADPPVAGEILVLGPVEIRGVSGAVAMTPRQRDLVAALVVADGRVCGVDELVDALWGGRPPSSATKLVRVYVSQLRKLLPDGVEIRTAGTGYSLAARAGAIDAGRFEQLVAEASSARQTGDHARAASRASQALGLWRGRAYGEQAYLDIVCGHAERLEELRVVALSEHVAAALALGRHAEILADALALARVRPLDEHLQELTMLALYRCGRQTEALDHYAAVRGRLRDELGLEPGTALRDLQQRILRHDPALDPAPAGPLADRPLPTPPNSLIGRQRELLALQGLLERRESRLLVLTGAGGTGKTRLALEAARAAAGSFANGAVLVDLAPLHDAAHVPGAIARALGVVQAPGELSAHALGEAIGALDILLVLDNAEHLHDAAPGFVDLLAQAPGASLLVTSRRVLHVSGEQVFPVSPLGVEDAAELFRERAAGRGVALDPDAQTESLVRDICRRVDGLPLAIELAAARVGTLTPQALLARLDARLRVLTSGPRDLPARQQTLRETIDWSVGLLDPDERRVLSRLSVFAGATLEAAERVCEATLDTISALVEHHLVQRGVQDGRVRLTLLETIHEYATELLRADQGERSRTMDALARWCRDLAEEAEPHLSTAVQRDWLDALEREHENMRVALGHLRDTGAADERLALAVLLSRFWYVRGYLAEGRQQLEDALAGAVESSPERRRRAHTAAASLTLLQGDHASSVRFAELALEDARLAGETRFVANALSNLGAIALAAGDGSRATTVLHEAVALAREVGDARIAALAINNLGDLALATGDYERARPLFHESLALLRARGDEANIARSLFNNGAVELMLGEVSAAAARFRESLELSRRTGDLEDTAWSLIGVAACVVEEGDAQRAVELLGAARAVLERMGADFKPFERDLDHRTEERCSRLLGPEGCAAGLALGASLALDDALDLAFGG
jgi:predicted ATPase/DNA-binding SARP family transcriptional activator